MKEKTLRQLAELFRHYGYNEAALERQHQKELDRATRAAFVKGQMVEAQRYDDYKRALDLQGGTNG